MAKSPLFSQQGQYVRLDAAGKQLQTYQPDVQGGAAANAEVLPDDRVVASLNIGRVTEYDNKGKAVWETNLVNPTFPHRLSNGHTLVGEWQEPSLRVGSPREARGGEEKPGVSALCTPPPLNGDPTDRHLTLESQDRHHVSPFLEPCC